MNVLNMDICDEALGFYERQKGEYVYHKAFPNAWLLILNKTFKKYS
jgi:hypothetical protein